MIKGYVGALLELFFFFRVAHSFRETFPVYQTMNSCMYYWFCFTVLTGFWEFIYVCRYHAVAQYAMMLKQTNTHVWTRSYKLDMILPCNLSKLFYAEYGAHADREYMSQIKGDYWSRLIESSHALCCALFCLSALVCTYFSYPRQALVIAAAGMGNQFMNSLLYMGEYFLQCSDKNSANYSDWRFPLGFMMLNRWFMWVNLAWLVFPVYVLCILV